MSTPDLVQQIEHVIHVRFGNPDLLEQALTHASKKGVPNYERLEFLGDRVLGLVIADCKMVSRKLSWPNGYSIAILATNSSEQSCPHLSTNR